ncbi:MAG: HEAT repeat domain-containing protein [Methanoregulaceae archaeon]|nr:HEAT repeat domain-containing protein [Methanoregulaceae archaeon]
MKLDMSSGFRGLHFGYREGILAGLIAFSLLLEVGIHWMFRTGIVYSHFFYVPIVVAGLWYGRRGLLVAVFLGAVHLGMTWVLGENLLQAAVRVLVFLLVAAIVGLLSERAGIPGHTGGHDFIPRMRSRLLSYGNTAELAARRDVPGLIRALRNQDINVQYEAVSALGEIGDPQAVGPLVDVLRDDKYSAIRWRAAEALASIGDPAIGALTECLSHPAEDVRWKAALALGSTGSGKAIDPLIRLLSDHDRFVRSRAANALGHIGQAATGPLIKALAEGDGNVRWGSVIALGQIGDPKGVIPLIRALDDKYEDIRSEATSALTTMGDRVVDPLIRAFLECGIEESSCLCTTLSAAGCAGLRKTIHKSLLAADPEFRRDLARVIRERHDPALEAFLSGLLGEETGGG